MSDLREPGGFILAEGLDNGFGWAKFDASRSRRSCGGGALDGRDRGASLYSPILLDAEIPRWSSKSVLRGT